MQQCEGCSPVSSLCDCFRNIDGSAECFLPADYSYSCPSEHVDAKLRALALAAVAFYGAGVPLLYAGLLHAARHAIRHGSPTPLSASMGFLHAAFQPDSLWWPLVEALRVLLLTGVLSLVDPGSLLQLFCALAFAISYNVLHIWTTPYRQPDNNFLAMGASTALIFSLLSSLGVQINAKYGGDAIDPRLLSAILFASGSLIFVVTLLIFFAALRRRHTRTSTVWLREPLVAPDAEAVGTVQAAHRF